MLFLEFLLKTVLISSSGVMAPGPVTAVALGKGARNPHAGAFISLGHAVVEFPIMLLLFFGLDFLFQNSSVNGVIAFIGGLFILYMGYGILKDMNRAKSEKRRDKRSPFVLGIVLSGTNAYFLIWWAFVGAGLIRETVEWGLAAFLAFALVHWLCDFVWLYFLSYTSHKGGRVYGRKFQKVLFAVCGVALIFFGISFIVGAFKFWLSAPSS